MRLKGKVAVITGAGGGMGEASAKLFAKEGAKVVVAEINAEAGRKVAQQIKQEGGEAIFVQVDVSKADDVKRMVQTTVDTYGRLDILFNNAGIAGRIFGSPPPPGKTQEEVELEDWRQVIDVNLMGPFIACLYAIPVMRKQGGGCILNTASTGALRAQPRSIAYATSKGGLVLTTKSLARAVVKDNIRVNAICPALVMTGLADAFMGYPKTEEERKTKLAAGLSRIPMGRPAKAEEIANAALFLVSDEASYITGVALPVDGGATI